MSDKNTRNKRRAERKRAQVREYMESFGARCPETSLMNAHDAVADGKHDTCQLCGRLLPAWVQGLAIVRVATEKATDAR